MAWLLLLPAPLNQNFSQKEIPRKSEFNAVGIMPTSLTSCHFSYQILYFNTIADFDMNDGKLSCAFGDH